MLLRLFHDFRLRPGTHAAVNIQCSPTPPPPAAARSLQRVRPVQFYSPTTILRSQGLDALLSYETLIAACKIAVSEGAPEVLLKISEGLFDKHSQACNMLLVTSDKVTEVSCRFG